MMPLPGAPENSSVEAPAGAKARRSSRPKAPGVPDPPSHKRVHAQAATEVLNPRDFVHIQALPDFGKKAGRVLARGRTIYRSSGPSSDEEFWENYRRRQKQLTRGYFTPIGKPYSELGEILYTDPKQLTLYSLGQLAQEPVENFVQEKPPKKVAKVTANKFLSSQESDSPEPLKGLFHFRETEKELRTLRKDVARSSPHDDIKEDDDRMQRLLEQLIFQNYQSLVSSRKSDQRVPTDESYPVSAGRHLSALGHYVNSVKKGGHYFQIFQRKALQKSNALKAAQQAQSLIWTPKFQPRKYSSDSEDSDEEISTCSVTEGDHLRNSGKKKKKHIILRSYTPRYVSVLITNPPGAKSEHLFRQLCAIHWLLKTLTLQQNSSMRSILTCWNPTDPGGYKKTAEEIKEENLAARMQAFFITETEKSTWEAAYELHGRKSQAFNLGVSQRSSQSSLRGQTSLSSITSSIFSSETNIKTNVVSSDAVSESAQDKEQQPSSPEQELEQGLVLQNRGQRALQKVIQKKREELSKDGHKQQDMVKKTGLQGLLPVDQKNHRVNMPFIKEPESAISRKPRPRRQGNQEERCYQKKQALKHLEYFSRHIKSIRQPDMKAKREPDEDGLKWFPVLLARLPESVKSDHYVQKILKKLKKYGKKPDLKIHPNTFVKVLADLQVWELCSPEIAAAVEFVRESIVQMPEEDFSAWFQTRVAPLSAQSSTS